MTRIRTKICGFTRPEDAYAAAQLGVDAVGLVFFAKSKRAVDIRQAQAIVAALPPFVTVVALFVNETAGQIRETLRQVPVGMIQFHGDEDDAFCRQFGRPYLKAVRVRGEEDIHTASGKFPNARALLFDAYHPGEYGGTGLPFDWKLLTDYRGKPWVLAGGLTADNVAEAVRISGAAAVDVSGGVESSGGIKDVAKIAAFLKAAAQAGGQP
ncbi:phosphoribosylanthranilate isomerase [Neisseria iguanae]|uniref:N-(5'-phosphoribosyl)anthranilate isomerase n=1 Tax=Neisseria iguanae TaxID=90242 RepID=A0A2P7U0E1_9NEIS|nr:phosphoribosylanthranilate isomerase [Neisseria iguanae]PSJ80411.1 phosphoribosylanthranilate isomerase [Neisseria iguanae]